jgi:hypothetical protein
VAPLALALGLALASPGLAPRLEPPLDPGPFQVGELAAASVGVFAGDALVLGAGYLTLQLFASDTLAPTAANFRRAAYVLGAAALVVPPLTAVLLARWARHESASGATWKAMLLATLGQAAAISAGLLATPHYWVVLPVQILAIGIGTSLGLHWGPRRRTVVERRAPDAGGEPAEPPTPDRAAYCPDPASAPPHAQVAG